MTPHEQHDRQNSAKAHWEERYAESNRIWTGAVNATLESIVGALPASGRAIDLGCGEGGDAVWLARLGWQVTAIDISPTALARGRDAAESAGLGDRIRWVEADLATWTPDASADLVTASFLQSTLPLPTAEILRTAADTLGSRGHLVAVWHAAPPPWSQLAQEHARQGAEHHDHPAMPTPEVQLAALELDPAEFESLVCEVRSREGRGPDGSTAMLDDAVLVVRRR